MSTIYMTNAARAYLAKCQAEARKIITSGDQFTPSQRAIAWAVLSGQPPHLRAPGRGPQPVVAEWPGNDGPSAT